MMKGKIETKRSGDGYLILEGSKDIYVHRKNMSTAMNGDIVRISLHKHRKRTEGKVVEIIERKLTKFIGILSVGEKYAHLTKIKNLNNDIFIPLDNLNGGTTGDKVLVEMIEWRPKDRNPTGKVIQIFGQNLENETEMCSIMYEYGFETEFPDEVLEEANNISFEITQEEIDKRKDLRDLLTIGIDPIGAQDFDDSISYRKLKNGNEEIIINIADVTHYIKKGSKIDNELMSRTTSVYLVDRCVPMLPEHLSNVVCSLNEGSDKLTFSYIFEFNKNYDIVNETFCRSVINMDKTMTYEEAQHMIDTNDNTEVGKLVMNLNNIAKKLRSRRDTIEFSRTEHRFILDENKVPIGMELKKSMDTNKLIEEFMLLTNRRVGEFIKRKKKPVLYRVHDKPNEDRLKELSEFVSRFGFELDISNEDKIKESLDKLMKDTEGDSMESLISTLAVRTMSKAYCTPDEKPHYGLNFDSYIWYTSPIRRAVDVIATRVLSDVLGNDGYPKK